MLSPVKLATPVRDFGRAATRPLRRYLDVRFDRLEQRLGALESGDGQHGLLARVDVTEHNTGRSPPGFDEVVSQTVSAARST